MKEAEKRGLLNLKTTVDALPHYIEPKNIKLFTKHKIFTESEMYSRYEILLENYCKTLHIEGKTMLDMIKKDIIPAVTAYCKELSETALSKKSLCPQVSLRDRGVYGDNTFRIERLACLKRRRS